MFGIGGPELVVILLVLLLFVGPDKLPAVVKTVGSGVRDLRRAANLAQHELRQSMDELAREVESVKADVTGFVDEQAREIERHARLEDEPAQRPPPKAPVDGETIAVVPRRTGADAAAVAPPDAVAISTESAAPQQLAIDDGPPPLRMNAPPDAPPDPVVARPAFNLPTGVPVGGTRAHGASPNMRRASEPLVVQDAAPTVDPDSDLPPPLEGLRKA